MSQGDDNASKGYSADSPIDRPDQDRFDRWPFAQRVANTIAERRDPSSLVVAIYGPWGDGKTSALRLFEHALKGHSNIIIVSYNPWFFREVPQLLRGFFDTLGDALHRSIERTTSSRWSKWLRRAARSKDSIGVVLKKYGKLLSLVASPLGEAAAGLGESLSSDEIEALRDRLSKILHDAGKRVVVLIDDVDRLDKEEVRAVLKLVKLSANFEHVTYLLAFDDEVVAASLGEAYGDGGTAAGRRFLEKIVQVSLHLPAADELELRKLAFEGIDEALRLAGVQLTESQANEFGRSFILGLEPALTTPRQAKRLQNALTFALPLLREEVNPVDQLLIESIRAFYPGVYLMVRENAGIFLQTATEWRMNPSQELRNSARATIEAALGGLLSEEQEGVTEVLQTLFPRLKSIFGNHGYGPEFEVRWENEKRICSEAYFWRYFRYTVPRGDMRDTSLDALLRNAEEGRDADIEATIVNVAAEGAIGKLVHKLEHRSSGVHPSAAASLALTLARRGDLFPHERGSFAFVTEPFTRSAILVSKLLKRVATSEREALAKKVIRDARPLPFAAECFRWLQYDKESEEDRPLSEGTEAELGGLLAKRIQEEAELEPLYLRYPERAALLLWLWKKHGDGLAISKYLEARFGTHPEETIRFLELFIGASTSLVTGLPTRSDFRKDAYESARSYVGVDIILSALRKQFGEPIGEGGYYTSDDVPFDRHIAHQFAFLARQASEKPGDEGVS